MYTVHLHALLILIAQILESCFGSNWKEVELVLHNDSAIEWFTDSGKQLGGIEIKSSPEKMAAGPVGSLYTICL